MASYQSKQGSQSFKKIKFLGDGGFGSVFLVLHNKWGKVAYKQCAESFNQDRHLTELKEEADRHRNLRHPNIVLLYEAVFSSDVWGLFIEYMKYGAVDKFLQDFDVPPAWRIQIIYETASAMSYLHEQNPIIIHGDLSSQNILIGDRFRAKICDFGLARLLKENCSSSKTNTPLRGKSQLHRSRIFQQFTPTKNGKVRRLRFRDFVLGDTQSAGSLLRFQWQEINLGIRSKRRETGRWMTLTSLYRKVLQNWLRIHGRETNTIGRHSKSSEHGYLSTRQQFNPNWCDHIPSWLNKSVKCLILRKLRDANLRQLSSKERR